MPRRPALAGLVALLCAGATAACSLGSTHHVTPAGTADPPPVAAAAAPVAPATSAPAAPLPELARRPVPAQAAAAAASARAVVPAPDPTATPVPTCPLSSYASPDPNRPVVALSFDLSADGRTVTGTESVTFRPDKAVGELVFRLWPNGSEGGRRAASLTVTKTSLGGSSIPFRTEAAGSRPGTQGTVLSLPLTQTSPAGVALTAQLSFVLRLPPVTWDRLGADATTSYWGSAHPMLAWERGVGWDRSPASSLPGETASGEAARMSLSVTAPADRTVVATGTGSTPVAAGTGRRLWRFDADAARDVAVVAGPLSVASTSFVVDGRSVTVVAAVAPGLRMPTALLLSEAKRALPALASRFGPVPFDVVHVVAIPGLVASGLEYPGMALLLPQPNAASTRVVETHELAHQWFYALVGNDQARDPWLDEAFATYAESLIDSDAAAYWQPWTNSHVGGSMASFGTDYNRYLATVYNAGTTALLDARSAGGPDGFDAAIRCYVRTSAWRIATPSSLSSVLTSLPASLAVLRRAGALPAGSR